jgi:two-component system sensor histidine kinase BaeS
MMRLGIKYKLMMIILAAVSLVVISIHLVGQWSFHRGFIRFINITEQARLEQLAGELQNIYAEEGNWDALRDRPARWVHLLRGTDQERRLPPRVDDRPARPFRDPRRDMPRVPPPDKLRHFEARVVLLDAGGETLFGFPHLFEEIEYKPLKHHDETVGLLGLAPQKRLADMLQLQFIKEQKTTFGLIAFGMVLLAALLTLPITGRLVRPVKILASATRELTNGNYKVRTPVASEDELGQLSGDFNTLADTLEQNEQARRQWVADISHELRTPLAVLRGEIEALQDNVREVTPQTLNTLHSEVLQLNRLVNDLYELSMSDLGALTYKKEMTSPVAVLKNTVALFQARLAARNLNATVDLSAGDSVEMPADRERLQQLFTNLLENSLRYTESGGRLEIRSEISGQRLTMHFLDSAPGVPDSDLPRLFDRLYRVEPSRNRAVGGAGLGLSICRNIVEAHDGSIEARPSPHGGLWLIINLPLNG